MEALAELPDGTLAVGCSADVGVVRLWDVAGRRCVGGFPTRVVGDAMSSVISMLSTREGELVTGCHNGDVLVHSFGWLRRRGGVMAWVWARVW